MSNYQYQPLKSWDEFENLCTEIFRNEWEDVSTQKHGRQGSKQNGVDLYGTPDGTRGYVGVQCKVKEIYPEKVITIRDIKEEAQKAESFEPKLEKLIIATTASKNVSLQKEVRKLSEEYRDKGLFSIAIYFWDDLEELINKYPKVSSMFYNNNARKNDIKVFKIISKTITYDGLICFLKGTHWDAKFDVSRLNEMYEFIKLYDNPNIRFESEDLNSILLKMYKESNLLKMLIGQNSYPCDESLNEVPFKGHTAPKEEQEKYNYIITCIENTAHAITVYYAQLINQGRSLI